MKKRDRERIKTRQQVKRARKLYRKFSAVSLEGFMAIPQAIGKFMREGLEALDKALLYTTRLLASCAQESIEIAERYKAAGDSLV